MKNCPVDPVDVTNSLAIFGPNCLDLRGKIVRQKPGKVEPEWVEIPRGIRELLRMVTLAADVMFVNGIPFLTTLSRSLPLRTTEHIPSCTANQLGRSIMKIVKLYKLGDFRVCVILIDMEFEKVNKI